jgi:hypothetical protein
MLLPLRYKKKINGSHDKLVRQGNSQYYKNLSSHTLVCSNNISQKILYNYISRHVYQSRQRKYNRNREHFFCRYREGPDCWPPQGVYKGEKQHGVEADELKLWNVKIPDDRNDLLLQDKDEQKDFEILP